MPQKVAVVGAGVVGLACAGYLQERGHVVTLIDPRGPGEHCSFGNAGCFSRASFVPLGVPGMWRKVPRWLLDSTGPLSIPLAYAPRIAPWLLQLLQSSSADQVRQIADALQPLMDASIRKWRPLADRAGVPELIVERGYAWAYESETAFKGDAFGRRLRTERGVRIDVLTGPAVREYEPALSPRVTHLVVMPEQGHCPNPLRLSQALAARLKAGGATFLAATARSFEVGGGRVRWIDTEQGKVLADCVVIAAGAHSRPLAKMLGADVPLETERGYHVMLEATGGFPQAPVMSGEGKYFATPMEGGLRVAGTVELAGLEAPPNFTRADALARMARSLFPQLEFGKVERWMGHRPSLPDSKPVLGRSASIPNAYFAFGHGHVGLTAAAPSGEIIADLVDGRQPYMDIRPFSAERFR